MTQAAQLAGARVLLVGMQVPPNTAATTPSASPGCSRSGEAVPDRAGALPAEGSRTVPTRALFQADGIHPRRKRSRMLDNVWPN